MNRRKEMKTEDVTTNTNERRTKRKSMSSCCFSIIFFFREGVVFRVVKTGRKKAEAKRKIRKKREVL